jgi:hypothetical protein
MRVILWSCRCGQELFNSHGGVCRAIEEGGDAADVARKRLPHVVVAGAHVGQVCAGIGVLDCKRARSDTGCRQRSDVAYIADGNAKSSTQANTR